MIKNYKKKVYVNIIAAIFSFIFRFIFIEVVKLTWNKAVIFTTLITVHISFVLDRYFKYQKDDKLYRNYIKKLISSAFGLLLTIIMWKFFIEFVGIHWIPTHFLSGIIIAIVFNFGFILEYFMKYQEGT